MSDDTGSGTSAGPDAVDRRMTLVPAIGVYQIDKDSARVRGSRTGVRVSTITCAPLPDDDEESLGLWATSNATLKLMTGPGDRGPLSGEPHEYVERTVVKARNGCS